MANVADDAKTPHNVGYSQHYAAPDVAGDLLISA